METTLYNIIHAIKDDSYFKENSNGINLDLLTDKSKPELKNLQKILEHYSINSFDADGNILTEGSILEHIQGEANLIQDEAENEKLSGGTFFHLDGHWYKAKTGFMDDINTSCEELLESIILPDLLTETWNHETDDENTYIEKYFDERHLNSVFPLHKAIFNGVELCDLLIKKNRSLYFVHIKQGFDGSVRDLVSQIYLSAKVFINDLKNSSPPEQKALIKGYFDAIKSLNGQGSYHIKFKNRYRTLREATFANLLTEDVDNYYFVFAIYDTAEKERTLPKDIKKFRSNIAKLSIVNLDRDLIKILPRYSYLKFVQISRS
jgi:uncharacterized protein (TIGR04141 family)